jgi:hypothetical protein
VIKKNSWLPVAPMKKNAAVAFFVLVASLPLPLKSALAQPSPAQPSPAQPSSPISADLAKKCRAMAIKAHPTPKVGSKGVGAEKAQRDYFQECVAKGGNIPD